MATAETSLEEYCHPSKKLKLDNNGHEHQNQTWSVVNLNNMKSFVIIVLMTYSFISDVIHCYDNLQHFPLEGMGDENVNSDCSAHDNTKTDKDVPKETDVGITEYVSELPGFSGVIKQR